MAWDIELIVDEKDGHKRDIMLYIKDNLRIPDGEIEKVLAEKRQELSCGL